MVTCATDGEGRREARRKGGEVRRARASRDRVVISPLNFSIPHPFTHPAAATSSFLRESPRGIASMMHPRPLTLPLTRISGRGYRARRRDVARDNAPDPRYRSASFARSIRPTSGFRYAVSSLRRYDALRRRPSSVYRFLFFPPFFFVPVDTMARRLFGT